MELPQAQVIDFFPSAPQKRDWLGGSMAYVPKDAEWYWAEVIVEITVAEDPRNVVHRNTVLIRADSPMQAYERAIEIGRRYEGSHENPEGALVETRFRGLGGLDVIHDPLEHGAELFYREDIAVSRQQIGQWICQRDELPLFQAEEDTDLRPDYGSKEIVDEVRKIIGSQE